MTRLTQLLKSWQIAGYSILLSAFTTAALSAQEIGRISGSLVDADLGEPVIAARVSLEGTEIGTNSTLDGSYRFQELPVGSYTLLVEKYGYRTSRITEVLVQADELTSLDIPLHATNDSIIELEAFVVRASDVETKGMKLMADRQQSSSISDAIGPDDFSNFGASDAADAMSRVTGVSVNDGKYVFVRGLGERYSNTLMNGVTLPSADPDKKAVQMDMFPTELLESIVTTKSFTPEKPGDFAGGSVNIKTKSFPDLRSFSVSSKIGYSPESSFNEDFLSYPGGDTDIFGWDDGTRDLPAGVPTNGEDWPVSNFIEGAPEFFEAVTKKFSSVLAPSKDKSFLDFGFNIDFGNSYYLSRDQLIGIVASFTYDLSFDHYDDGINARYRRDSITNPKLGSRYTYNDTKSTMSAALGGLLSVAYQPNTNHEFSLILTSNQSITDEARFQQGPTGDSGSDADSEDQVRSMQFTERNVTSAQLKAEHFLEDQEIKINWSLTSATTSQKDPDARYSNNEIDTNTGRVSLVKPNRAPRRVFRDLTESQNSATIDFEIPLFKNSDLEQKLKIGGVINDKNRDFSEYVYSYQSLVVGNAIFSDFETIDTFLEEDKIGILDDGPMMKRFINFARSQVYEGTEKINAAYVMIDFELSDKWRTIAGVRQENTKMTIESLVAVDEQFFDPTAAISEDKVLPAFHLVYQLSEQQNLRASYATTLARPTMRELAPYRSFPFIGGDEYLGNQNLRLTEIDNFDLRWEWFPNAGETVSVSFFYKELSNPIDVVVGEFAGNFRQQPQNVASGEIMGLEFELRKSLGFISDRLQDFSINSNITISKSEVDNSNQEFISKVPYYETGEIAQNFSKVLAEQRELHGVLDLQSYDRNKLVAAAPNTPLNRNLFGQPDLIVNFSLNYNNPITLTSVALNFNYVGDKLVFASQGATPDVYDAATEKFDFILKQQFGDNWSIKFSAKNLTDAQKERYYDSEAKDIYSSYSRGRSFSVSATYSFD